MKDDKEKCIKFSDIDNSKSESEKDRKESDRITNLIIIMQTSKNTDEIMNAYEELPMEIKRIMTEGITLDDSKK
jgi:hypothetical protein